VFSFAGIRTSWVLLVLLIAMLAIPYGLYS
jgi:hypothetical protein